MTISKKTETWNNCYDKPWGEDLLVPEAMTHPAKFSLALATRIVTEGLRRGWWSRGDRIVDPFGGVGCGGLVCAYAGLEWHGCELEPHFVKLAKANFRRNRERILTRGGILPRIAQGDSRQLQAVLSSTRAQGGITSPPFVQSSLPGADTNPQRGLGGPCGPTGHGGGKTKYHNPTTTGQVGALIEGDFQGVVTSPPFARQSNRGGDTSTSRKHKVQTTGCGTSPGQLDALPEGDFTGAITSPPFQGNPGGIHDKEKAARFGERFGKGLMARHLGGVIGDGYGTTDGQIGALGGDDAAFAAALTSPPYNYKGANQKGVGRKDAKSGQTVWKERTHTEGYGATRNPQNVGAHNPHGAKDTYWTACHQIYEQLHQILVPDGVAALVVKDYVQRGEVVPLCDRTAQLLESVGFEVFLRARATLVRATVQRRSLLDGTVHEARAERKSFFRRMHEQRGAPRIDWEEVLVCRKR